MACSRSSWALDNDTTSETGSTPNDLTYRRRRRRRRDEEKEEEEGVGNTREM